MGARIEELIQGQASLIEMELPTAVARQAQRIAAQCLTRMARKQTEKPTQSGSNSETREPDVQSVYVDSLELVRPRTVGVEPVGLWAMPQMGFIKLLVELGISGPFRAAIAGSVSGRMAVPGSEAATYRWLCRQSALGELLDVDFESMNPITLYRASDRLMRHRAVIERHLFEQLHDWVGLTTTVTLYDLTKPYFEGTAAAKSGAAPRKSAVIVRW